MRNRWKPSNKTIGDIHCIELETYCLGHYNIEYSLSGENGEIWEVGYGRYAAIVLIDSKARYGYREQLVRFGEEDLGDWIRRLSIPNDPKEQAMYANTFGRI